MASTKEFCKTDSYTKLIVSDREYALEGIHIMLEFYSNGVGEQEKPDDRIGYVLNHDQARELVIDLLERLKEQTL